MQVLQAGFGIEDLVDVAPRAGGRDGAGGVGRRTIRPVVRHILRGAVARGMAHRAQVVPRQKIRVAQASGRLHPLHIRVEIARQHPRRIGPVKADLAIAVEVPADAGRRRITLANPLAIRPIVKVHSPAIGGDGRGRFSPS